MSVILPALQKPIPVFNPQYQINGSIFDYISSQYTGALLFIMIGFGIAFAMMILPFFLTKRKPYAQKVSPYECGFEPVGEVRNEFNVQFYVVALLFIIFDLEVAFLFPWAISLKTVGIIGFCSMMFFLFVLTIGFVYEWLKGALEWK